jgi:hypothetical protein
MRTKLLIPSLVLVVLGIAACGSSSSSSISSASKPSTTATTTPAATGKKGKTAAVPSRTYTVKLTGAAETPPGAPTGTGAAVIALHGKTLQVCWRFAHLHGFTSATFAHIHIGPKGTSGNIVVPMSTGPSLQHKGCVSAAAAMIEAIEKNPHGYYVNIHSKKYPGGAVRAQL